MVIYMNNHETPQRCEGQSTPNQRGGECAGCLDHLFADEGFVYHGQLFCSHPVTVFGVIEQPVCERRAASEVRQHAKAVAARAEYDAGKPRWMTPGWEAREAERKAQAEAWAAEGLVRCDHCGGAGGHDYWPGVTCFCCNGVGAVPK
jgi:hypothetical protein